MTNHISFKHEPLDIQEITGLVTAASCGAISLFVGTTRDNFDGKTVIKLEYEAYESMGMKAMEKICQDIRKQWVDVENIAIFHRLGKVPVKEASIIIAISSPHRDDALKATEFCINSVKKSVPIWKKEIYSNNEAAWKENKESPYPPKRKKIKFEIVQEVQTNYIPPHLVQIRAANADLNARIEKFMERKRDEINIHNNTEFFIKQRDPEECCARVDAIVLKRKDCKSHLQVERVLNTYHRDQKNSDYMTKYIPKNGIEERLQILETQLSLDKAVPKNIYQRLKHLEDRLLLLESLSPEYVGFWDKTNLPTKSVKKKTFLTSEIDELIAEIEKKCAKRA
ncbi:molybdopterin synthase catalytic subunit isoform X2 [Anthonomus grandis grandis]|uniref:molybdopterin synthase catalytic subunit isoform X2 n=1 Tax=Anthonomus grandis grandis TaxID=2921223 RepID=UPI002166A95D|nr:molybdopterin synthase catalytic subunit isoform X2 [Anthonomus grandis grandis]